MQNRLSITQRFFGTLTLFVNENWEKKNKYQNWEKHVDFKHNESKNRSLGVFFNLNFLISNY